MNTITLSQPWASLVIAGKVRAIALPFACDELGEVAIVAARSFGRRGIEAALAPRFLAWMAEFGYSNFDDIPRGVLIGTARVMRCGKITSEPWDIQHPDEPTFRVTTEGGGERMSPDEAAFGDWKIGRFAWHFAILNPCIPIPCQGSRGLRKLRPDVERAMLDQRFPEAP